MNGNTSNAFGKTICSICYEDLKPLIEDLQSINICGHVFHELCLQQWLEYCDANKCTCPVCKQKCKQNNVNRLYFQSVGDSSEVNSTQKATQGLIVEEKDPVFLVREVNKLKGKVSAVTTICESQEKHLKELNEELCHCKEKLQKGSALKNEALQQKTIFQGSFRAKSEELVKTTAECSRLQERNMALAKELAALKLVSDLNLEEEEVLKLASFGNATNSRDTIDVLKKSLVLRNKSYKELMAQCNLLGRGETRSLKKLEKAKEKMKTLKARVTELELALEERDNAALRSLKASSIASGKIVDSTGLKYNAANITNVQSTNQAEHSAEPDGLINHSILFKKPGSIDVHKDLGLKSCKKAKDVVDVDLEDDLHLFMGDISSDFPLPIHKSSTTSNAQTNNHLTDDITFRESTVSETRVDFANEKTPSRFGKKNVMEKSALDAMDDDVVHLHVPSSVVEGSSGDEVAEILPFEIRKEVPSPVIAPQPGDKCFIGGLMGPDGANWHLGKWCKRTQSTQGSSTSQGDLVAVGADGRGGRVKILRSVNQIDVKSSSVLAKKSKNGKQISQPSQGCMQIDHFFAKAERS